MINIYVNLLQDRMNKCLKDQMWAVGLVLALNGIFIGKSEDLRHIWWWLFLLIGVLCTNLYSLYYIYHRHISYYQAQNTMANLLPEDAPDFLRTPRKPWTFRSLIGLILCYLWIIGSCVAGSIILITQNV